MRTWWRQNRWPLALLVVLIPAAVYTALSTRFIPTLVAEADVPRAVSLGDAAAFANAELTMTDLVVVPGADVGAPEGRDVVVAAWHVDVQEAVEYGGCRTYAVATIDGTPREWEGEGYASIDVEFDERFEYSCDLSEVGEYDLLQTYFVPAGEVDAVSIEVRSSDGASVLRFTE